MTNKWIENIFKAATAKRGGVVRRKKASVLRYASLRELKAAVRKRGFHLLRSGGQYLIICNPGACRIII